MLVLTREAKTGSDEIVIGKPGDVLTQPIIVTLVEQRGARDRIGVHCQRDVVIVRGELLGPVESEKP